MHTNIYIYAGVLVISIKDINLVVGVQYQLAGVPLISRFYPEGLTDQGRLEAREEDPPLPCDSTRHQMLSDVTLSQILLSRRYDILVYFRGHSDCHAQITRTVKKKKKVYTNTLDGLTRRETLIRVLPRSLPVFWCLGGS